MPAKRQVCSPLKSALNGLSAELSLRMGEGSEREILVTTLVP